MFIAIFLLVCALAVAVCGWIWLLEQLAEPRVKWVREPLPTCTQMPTAWRKGRT